MKRGGGVDCGTMIWFATSGCPEILSASEGTGSITRASVSSNTDAKSTG